ncbi:MAG: hypothetical protein Q9207_000695 [Kuettlingeria erythrocarpa]
MKAFTFFILASVLALTTAVPLEKRVLVVHTVTDVVVTTIESTTTVWVKPTHAAHLAQHAHNHAHKIPAPAPAPAPATAPAPAPKKAIAPVAAKPQSPPEIPSPLPVANKAAVPVAAPATPSPPEAAPVVQKAPQPAAAVYQAPSPPAVPPPSPSPVVAPPAPAPETKSYPNVDTISGSTADCGKVGMPCSGDITFYDTGLGACGWTNDGTTENVFALAHGMMGAQSNGNPFCGRQAEVSLNGKTVKGKLVDKCGGCQGQSIDLSHSMFQALADEGKGRISDVKWRFID